MALDPELASFLAIPLPNDISDVLGTRRQLAALGLAARDGRGDPPLGLHWDDSVVESVDGRVRVPVRVYTSERHSDVRGALLFFHGGAFVFGDLESEHERCVRFADQTGCLVISVDYRLAPEHPFPAALDDGVTVLAWLRRSAEHLGVDPTRIAVGGASAGGALAAGLALRSRDEEGPWLRAQLLIYPVVDDRCATPSIGFFEHAEPWDGERTRMMWRIYLAGQTKDVSPYASVARATDLSNLPPTYIMTAEQDPLRDEAIEYAQRLMGAGTSVELHHFPGTYHGFDVVAPGSQLSERALEDQVAFLRRELDATD